MKLKKISLFIVFMLIAGLLRNSPVVYAGQISRVYVNLMFSAFDPGNGSGIVSIIISNSGDFSTSIDADEKGSIDDGIPIAYTVVSGKNYALIQNWKLATGDWVSDTNWDTSSSRRTVYVKFIDGLGNEYKSSQHVDISGSDALDYAEINEGGFYTNNPLVTINFKGADRYRNLQISGDGGMSWYTPPMQPMHPGVPPTNYSSSDWSVPFTLTPGDDTKYINLKANMETTASGISVVTNTLSIILDQTPPAINRINVLPQPSVLTQAAVVSGNFSDLTSGIAQKFYAPGVHDVSYFPNGTDVQTFNSDFTVTANGTYTICVEDNAGNYTTASAIVSNIGNNAGSGSSRSSDDNSKISSIPVQVTNVAKTSANGSVTVNINFNTPSWTILIQKWAAGKQGVSYFANSGAVFTGNSLSLSKAGTYTVYAKDSLGSETVYTFQITDADINKNSSDIGSSTGVKAVKRIYGNDRAATSIAIARELYGDKLQNVILATEDNFPDALSGSVLANKVNAPILLVGKDVSDSTKVLDYVNSSMNKNGKIYILGGNGTVSASIEAALKAKGYISIKRLGGDDRYKTCSLIADEVNVQQGTPVVIATGDNFPDALSISSVAASKGYPILIIGRHSVPECIKQNLALLKPQKIYVAGGNGAIDDKVLEELLQDTGLGIDSIVRLSGSSRYETSSVIADYFKLGGGTVTVATGRDFPDALTGSVYAAKKNEPILLLDEQNAGSLKDYISKNKFDNIVIFGGNSVIDQNVEDELSK